MPNTWFQFKQFRIEQDQTAMKVGTDGVLLGAWTDLEGLTDQHWLLDIGTGTGLIALMAAQRCQAWIWAIEIEENAASQAEENFIRSPWSQRIRLICGDVREKGLLSPKKFDHIISNPPYFSQAVPAPDKTRNLARHDLSLSIPDLASRLSDLLSSSGKVSLILPAERFHSAHQTLARTGLSLQRKTSVLSKKNGQPLRILAQWGYENLLPEESTLSVFSTSGEGFSEAYRRLTRDFYPGF